MVDESQHGAALDRILELVVLLNDDMTRRLARDGLTVSRAHVLWELGRRGPMTQKDLAGTLRVSARTVTGLIDGLVATGFVTREPHPADRRAFLVTFTEHGADTVRAMAREQVEFGHLLFARMPERRFAGLVAGLDDILSRLRDVVSRPHQEHER